MPRQEFMKSPEELQSMAFQAHVQRTQGRIAAFRARLAELATPETTPRPLAGLNRMVPYEQEKADILAELQILERQLTEPLTKMTLSQRPVQGPEPVNPFLSLVQKLQSEIADLKTKFGASRDAEPVATPVAG